MGKILFEKVGSLWRNAGSLRPGKRILMPKLGFIVKKDITSLSSNKKIKHFLVAGYTLSIIVPELKIKTK